MFKQKSFEVSASEIAGYLNRKLNGEDFILDSPYSIVTSKIIVAIPDKNEHTRTLYLGTDSSQVNHHTASILTDTPELDLAYILKEFFSTPQLFQSHPTAIISKESHIGRNVLIGPFVFIGDDVSIGDYTQILAGAKISGPATLGKYCVIKEGSVIGSEGWDFIPNEDNIPVHIPQLGQIIIGNRVWLGANSTIERAMLEKTTIEDDVKIDDLVHIGGGSKIGLKSEITAGTVISRNVTLGENVRIHPQSVLRSNISVGNKAVIGQGAVVLTNVTDGVTVVGNPAKEMKKA